MLLTFNQKVMFSSLIAEGNMSLVCHKISSAWRQLADLKQ